MVWNPDNRENGPRNELPLREWNHGMNIEHIARSIVRPQSEVSIVLERYAYQIRQRVRGRRCQFLV